MSTDVAPSPDIDFYYFDPVLEAIEGGNTEVARCFGRHNHWGYWADPARCDGSVDDFAAASENLTRLLCDAAAPRAGSRVLDAGCGFGGTIGSLNERWRDLDLTGINIDPRQLQRAEAMIKPKSGNTITWVKGNACKLPFADRSFDAVLAVECIFHFPSRQQFFAEAARVLKPGGRLVLSDMVSWAPAAAVLPRYVRKFHPAVKAIWGNMDIYCTRPRYRELAARAGFGTPTFRDITRNILPTYDFCMRKIPGWHGEAVGKMALPGFRALKGLKMVGLLRYETLQVTKK